MAMVATEIAFGIERRWFPQPRPTERPLAQFVPEWFPSSVTQVPLGIHDFDALHNGPIVLSVEGAAIYRQLQAGPLAPLPDPLPLDAFPSQQP